MERSFGVWEEVAEKVVEYGLIWLNRGLNIVECCFLSVPCGLYLKKFNH